VFGQLVGTQHQVDQVGRRTTFTFGPRSQARPSSAACRRGDFPSQQPGIRDPPLGRREIPPDRVPQHLRQILVPKVEHNRGTSNIVIKRDGEGGPCG
jgi:hypothetical protein